MPTSKDVICIVANQGAKLSLKADLTDLQPKSFENKLHFNLQYAVSIFS